MQYKKEYLKDGILIYSLKFIDKEERKDVPMKRMSQEECKKELIRILKFLDNICIKNNIKYSLVGGSLIGAVRHNGIIPWDDDIDVGMMYKDFIKLKEILKTNNNEFELLTYENCDNYYSSHSKLVSKRTKLYENNYEEIENLGIFIDIFSFFYIPEKNGKKFFNEIKFKNRLIAGLRKPSKSEDKKLLRYIRYFICNKIIGRKLIYKSFKKVYTKYPKGNSIICEFTGYPFENQVKDANIFDNLIRKKFNGIDVNIVSQYDKVLKDAYGNYMELPPMEKRVTHGITAYWREM